MQPFSPHNRFFSSLNQLQQRLSSEQNPNRNPSPTQNQQPSLSSSASPLYLTNPIPDHQPTTSSSGPPLEFLSNSPTNNHHRQQQQQKQQEDNVNDDDDDDIESLIELLGLSDQFGKYREENEGSCDCRGGGFYSKIAGVKGPRCEREGRRLEGWIELYREEKREPARLAHLLIGKVAALSGAGSGFEEVEFPGTVEEFLECDPVMRIKGE